MLSYRPPIDRLQKLKLAEEAFKSGAPELYRDLRRIAVAGEVLFETTMVRDFEAETRADSKEPKFKPELKPMGPLRGSAFVRARTLSDSLDARQKAFASFIRMIAQGTDDLSERQLRVAIGSLEESDTRAREAIALLNKAHEFFQQRNLDRIRRSNLKSSRELPEIAEQKFGFCNRRADVSWHPVPVPTAISLPPTLDAV